jgi:RsiW-degrading membrane proteinase PrsW (M82 family)
MSADQNELIANRERAIEESGWGLDFTFVQPHNLAFWVYSILVAAGTLLSIKFYVTPGVKAYDRSFAFGAIAFALYTVPFWLFLRHEDRFTSVPPKLAVAAFIYGATASISAFAALANDSIRNLWAKSIDQAFAFDWSAALTAPLSEEIAKASGLVLLLVLAPRLIRSPFDGLILGAFLGLGFQVVEDVAYSINGATATFGADQIQQSALIVGFRMFTGLASHWVYSAIFCAGLVYFIGRKPSFPPRRLHGAGLMLLALLFHAAWDGAGAIAAGDAAASALIELSVVVGVLSTFIFVYKSTVKTERNWMRELMSPEVESGVITESELEALAGTRKERKAFINSAEKHGSRKTARHVIVAAGDLAHAIARDGGASTPLVIHARDEVLRLRG